MIRGFCYWISECQAREKSREKVIGFGFSALEFKKLHGGTKKTQKSKQCWKIQQYVVLLLRATYKIYLQCVIKDIEVFLYEMRPRLKNRETRHSEGIENGAIFGHNILV